MSRKLLDTEFCPASECRSFKQGREMLKSMLLKDVYFYPPYFMFKLKAFAEYVSMKPLKESDMLLHGKTKIESGNDYAVRALSTCR